MDVNAEQKTKLIPRIKEYFKGNLKGKTIAMWGLAFKPHTDDIREAPSLYNIEELLKEGVIIKAHDPEGMKNVERVIGRQNSILRIRPMKRLKMLMQFLLLQNGLNSGLRILKNYPRILKEKVIFDGRNLYDLQLMKELGYKYFSIGREVING